MVAITLPCAFVERSADGVFEIAKDVVVALVAVAFVVMSPPLNERSVVVAFEGNGSATVASVPQLRTPALDALTSHAPLVRLVMANDVAVAFVRSAVVMVPDAIVVLPFAVRVPEKMLVFVKVFEE